MFIPTLPQTRQKRGWSAPGLLDQLKQDLGANFVAELVHTFLDHLAGTLTVVAAASAAGDLGTVAKQIHSLKGSSRQLEVEVIGTICEQIETLAKENKLREVQLLTKRLEEESKVVQRVLGAYVDGSSESPVQ
jgi:HPt (histidine-containing phosphotransfer) domain-containing protein